MGRGIGQIIIKQMIGSEKMYLEIINREGINKFHQGENHESYKIFGAHITNENGKSGVRFTLWAPSAKEVSVLGDFNKWQGAQNRMDSMEGGIWTTFVWGIGEGDIYKYEIITIKGERLLKSDPFGFYSEKRPATASVVFNLDSYKWRDEEYLINKGRKGVYEEPVNIYEVHLGSWKRRNRELLSYRELGEELVNYVLDMGYTHIELLPLMEHPYDGSWGYQATGYYSVTSRYGDPREFMGFVDKCHSLGIGVIIDWVPGHFCKDDHGLRLFDGTPLFEYMDSRRSENYGWGTLNFDHGRPEVLSFLISNAFFYFDVFHVDGIRVDAVASMLYLDYGRGIGEWSPNIYGGRENLEAINFMKMLNEVIFEHFPNALMIAEESTAWPMVTKPAYSGGLGYNYKWNMGWMNDILRYMEMESLQRKWNPKLISFSFMYALSENYILPLSHDEVVHCKKSLFNKMSGDYFQKFSGLRALYAFMFIHPGKKLLFMGGEFGQSKEWDYDGELDWRLLEMDMHKKLQGYVKILNALYKADRALYEMDHGISGFEVIDANDASRSIIVIGRYARNKEDSTIAVCNFASEVHYNYRIGVPFKDSYFEVLNSDALEFGGSGEINNEELLAKEISWHNKPYSIEITIPPLGVVYFKKSNKEGGE